MGWNGLSKTLRDSDTNVWSLIFPLIKKQGLDPEILKNYRPVANL